MIDFDTSHRSLMAQLVIVVLALVAVCSAALPEVCQKQEKFYFAGSCSASCELGFSGLLYNSTANQPNCIFNPTPLPQNSNLHSRLGKCRGAQIGMFFSYVALLAG
jgi:hypothetical protein